MCHNRFGLPKWHGASTYTNTHEDWVQKSVNKPLIVGVLQASQLQVLHPDTTKGVATLNNLQPC